QPFRCLLPSGPATPSPSRFVSRVVRQTWRTTLHGSYGAGKESILRTNACTLRWPLLHEVGHLSQASPHSESLGGGGATPMLQVRASAFGRRPRDPYRGTTIRIVPEI